MKPLEDLGRDVARGLGEGPDAARRLRQREAVIALSRRARPFRWRFAVASSAAAIACVAAVAGVLRVRSRAEPVAFWVGGETSAASPGAELRAPASGPLPVHFADGTDLLFARESRGAVHTTSGGKVEVVLFEGRLGARVNKGLRWTFAAGPYEVSVLGTRLEIEWKPAAAGLVVAVQAGAVKVRGGALGEPGLEVTAGRQLRIESEGINLAGPLEPTPTEPAPAPPPSPLLPMAPPAPSPAPPRKVAPASSWRALAAGARWAEALAAAEQQGFSALTSQLDVDDLVLLADCARYARAPQQTRRALVALERRFPASRAGRNVPFLLARASLELEGDAESAARELERYLRTEPEGEFAEEASGRLIEAWQRTGDSASACAAARDYLQRFPRGTYRSLARTACVP